MYKLQLMNGQADWILTITWQILSAQFILIKFTA